MNYAHTEYGLLAIRLRLKEEYPSVLATLTEFERDDVSEFPAHLFEVAVIRAVIWSELGNLELAKKFANQALIEAAKTHSGFRYHAKLGLVDTSDAELRRLVEHIAGQ